MKKSSERALKLILDFADRHPFLTAFIAVCVSLSFVKQDLVFILQHL